MKNEEPDWSNMGLSPEQVALALAQASRAKPRAAAIKRSARPFVKFPVTWLDRLAEVKANGCTYQVARRLLNLASRTGARRIELANMALLGMGISRKSKHTALRELEAAGLALIQRQARKSPVVQLLIHD
jgi:hypothetical protein